MIVPLIKRSLCPCGFPVLHDDIPLGSLYEVDPGKIIHCTLVCGGCGQKHPDLPSVWVHANPRSAAGYLPAAIFDLPDPNAEKSLIMYVVYDHPADYPAGFLVRRHFCTAGLVRAEEAAWATAPTLDEIHGRIPPGLSCLPRFPEDDPVIVEVWL